jgi:hypothetical protein
MNAIPAIGVGRANHKYLQLSLHSKSAFLRDRIRLARQSGRVPPEIIQRIENHLNAVAQENDPAGQWNSYELAFESYLPLASEEDLLGDFLGLRTKTYRLDQHSQEVWSKEKLQQMEFDIRNGQVSSTLREEVVTLARAIHECDFHRRRSAEAKSKLIRMTFYVNAFLCVLAIACLTIIEILHVAVKAPWPMVVAGLFGAIGALVTSSFHLREHFYGNDIQVDRASLFFRAALGAIAAVIVTLFLQLPLVDFPFLHADHTESGALSPAALYVFGFVSGLAVQALFGTFEKRRVKDPTTTKRSEDGDEAFAKQGS